MKKVYFFFFFFLFCLNTAFARSYYIKNADININILADGTVNITETRTFSFDGCYTVIYQQIPLYNDSNIISYSATASDSYNEAVNHTNDYFMYEYYFHNRQCDKDTTVVLNYQLTKVVNAYNDISELHYVFWGHEWPKTNTLSMTLSLPETIDTYWIHPFIGISQEHSQNNNVITYSATGLQEGRWVEARVLFPRIETTNVNVINSDARERITSIEQSYQTNNQLSELINNLLFLLPIIPIIIYVYIYYKHGIEPKVLYSAPYEREPPTKQPPAIVNATINSDKSAQPNIDAFIATIFDLVNRGYAKIEEVKYYEKKIFGGQKIVKDIEFTLLDKDETGLKNFEKDVMKFLKKHARFQGTKNKVLWEKLEKKLKEQGYGLKFKSFFNKWKNKVDDEVDEDKYFVSKGRNTFLVFGIIYAIILGLGLFFGIELIIGITSMIEAFYIDQARMFTMTILALITTTILLVLPAIILGRRTKEGTTYYLKWMNFKKFLQDFSLLKEHPPASVKVWEHFMVYAIALGVADKVIKAMKIMIPETTARTGTYFYVFYSRPRMFHTFHNTLYASSMTQPRSSSGGFGGGSFGGGGFGGGFGGGGGGAR